MKKLVTLLLVFTMVLSTVQFTFAELDEDNIEYELLESRLNKSDRDLLRAGYSTEYIEYIHELQNKFSLNKVSKRSFSMAKQNVIIKITPENREKLLSKYGIEVPEKYRMNPGISDLEEELIIVYTEPLMKMSTQKYGLELNSLRSYGYEWPTNFYKKEVSYGYPNNGYKKEITQDGEAIEDALNTAASICVGLTTTYAWIAWDLLDVEIFDFGPNANYVLYDQCDAYTTKRTTQMVNGNINEVVASVQTSHSKITHFTRLAGYNSIGAYKENTSTLKPVKTSPHYWDTTWINNQLATIFENSPGSTVYDPY